VTFRLDGELAYPSTGDVVDVETREIVTSLTDETGRPVMSEKMVEIHINEDGEVVETGDQFGLGRVTVPLKVVEVRRTISPHREVFSRISRGEFPQVEVLFNKDAGHELIAQALAQDWQQNLGVPVRLAMKEIKVYKNDLKNANYMTSRAGWFGDYGDPTTFLDLNRSDDGNNDRKYANPEYDALLDEAARETDPQRRLTILADAERMIMERDLPMVPLFHYVSIYLFDPDEISGINPHPRTQQDLFLIDVLGDGKGPDLPRVMRDRISDPPFAAIPDASASITAQPATGP